MVVEPNTGAAPPPLHTLDRASRSQSNAASYPQLHPPHYPTPTSTPRPDLSNAATSSASEYHSVAPVVIGSHGGQAILLVHKQGRALYSNRASQWLVEVLPTEVIVDL